jgi:glycosyltransferase involved in cell wall biosynthesis
MNRAERRARGKRGKAAKRATIGLAVIARDEEATLPTLLASVAGAFDQVVLVDTGSTDATVAVFEDWCRRTGQLHAIDTFVWRDDFAAARQYAQSLLTTDWACWADGDDTVAGARNLRRVVAAAPPTIDGFAFTYDYLFDADGRCILSFPRERLARRGCGAWVGRIHEHLIIDGGCMEVPRTVAHWSHSRKTEAELEEMLERDERYFEQWRRDEPDSPWVLIHESLERSGR